MDDNQILMRGGDEHDIEAFAEQNGADLTENDICHSTTDCKEAPIEGTKYCISHEPDIIDEDGNDIADEDDTFEDILDPEYGLNTRALSFDDM
jgi:hypothetical protein